MIKIGMGAETRVVATERAVKEETMEADRRGECGQSHGWRVIARVEGL